MNIKNILKEIKQNPLDPLIHKLEELNSDKSYASIQKNIPEIHLIRFQYNNYFLSCERVLKELSIERRFRNGPYFALKYGVKYTDNERKVADKYNEIKRYTELDFYNFVLHARILMDCVTRIARYFIKGDNLPKFGSFESHRKFFLKKENHPFKGNQKYASHIKNHTNWFENLLKFRNDLLVHAKYSHMRLLGISSGSNEFKLHIIWDNTNQGDESSNVISVVESIDNIQEFLIFFNNFGCGKI